MSLLSVIRERRQAHRQRAIKGIDRLVSLLKDSFVFDELYLCGSILKEGFHRHSDIDLVIKGLSAEDFFKAYALLIRESDFQIDLKPFEDLTNDFKDYVITRGVRIG
ncbi:MAG TPA: hypothetical protein HPP56_00100 [Nitrospirae bacterium]|nr:hypothetical protein [Nitrospirota bacterium]